MKNKALIYIILIISLMLIKCESYQTEHSVIVDCPQLRTIGGITKLNDIPFTGSCYVYEDVIIYEVKSFNNGVPHGIHKRYYYPSDALDYVGYRKKGHIHGPYTKYHPNGNIAATGQFRRGLYRGKWKYYDEEGNLLEERDYGRAGNVTDTTIIK